MGNNHAEEPVFACTLFGKVSNNNRLRQVSWLVTVVSVLLIPPWRDNGYADDTTRVLLTVARQPVIFTRFPIKHAEKVPACTAINYL